MKQYKKPGFFSFEKGGRALVPVVLAALPAASAVGVAAVGVAAAAKAVKQFGDGKNILAVDTLEPITVI